MRSSTEQLLFLKQGSIFRGMTFGQLQGLIALLETQQFVEGQVIYNEGEMGQNLYIVACGVVRVVKDYKKPTERELSRLKSGDFFGEMGIFERKPHMATVIADEDVRLFVLTAETFKRLIVQHPSITLEMGRELSARIRRSSVPDQRR
jgi:CRP/FNR family transcriptional regulator